MASPARRIFAPLKKDAQPNPAPKLQGIVFDMDGTLCEPQTYMFADMRKALNIPKTTDVLHHIQSLPPHRQPAAKEAIRTIERKAMASQVPQPGLATLMAYLDDRSVPKAICTRNFDVPVRHLLDSFLPGSAFHPVVTREFKPPKPDPAGILHIAQRWGLADAKGLIMVGDSIDDMAAGRRAGAATVLLVNSVNATLATHEYTDLVIGRLDDLVAILENGFEGKDAGQRRREAMDKEDTDSAFKPTSAAL
ncbi:HAD-like domain protein [Metarhizium album ARSEF 1941]|uniref:HAD-like domain protein n=1 Tax=Metarhizium album (strain ARSEF 1941) TaxID=1081103 RepID=A0A0B2WTZ9_METAS|nr:HAD-like domain protein [Metarhizium album ARSEF 1941]KHN96395.1 HAD-like domain protein [Metarhizium album ARSEF 1941]